MALQTATDKMKNLLREQNNFEEKSFDLEMGFGYRRTWAKQERSTDVLLFLNKLFEDGEKTGNKLQPEVALQNEN